MNEQRTSSMLQRLPVILAVTAASYGLPLQVHARHSPNTAGKAVVGAAGNTAVLPRAPARSA